MTWVKALLKDVVKRASAGLGYRIIRIREPHRAIPINVFPLVVEDWVARRSAAGRSDAFFFVQIGAHDGLQFDPIRAFVEKYHWRGLLVEPQPRIFRRLVQNYQREPQLAFENAAIADRDGEATLYAFCESPDLPEHATMLASFRRDALERNTHGYRGAIEELRVPALTLASLLARHQVREIDLLQIDTEGFDFQIVKMLAASALRPAVIHFESAALDGDEMGECHNLLHACGYRTLTIGIDTIAYRQAPADGFEAAYRVSPA